MDNSEEPMPEKAVNQPIPFKELQDQFRDAQSDEEAAFLRQQRVEYKAFQHRQLDRRLKFLSENSEALAKAEIKDIEERHRDFIER